MNAWRASVVRAFSLAGASRSSRSFHSALAFPVALALSACASERVEYCYRPDFAVQADAPKDFVRPDGTRVIFVSEPLAADREHNKEQQVAKPKLGPDGKPIVPKMFELRETLDDGTVILRNIMPDHVVGNTMTCMRNEEYKLMWDQLIAPETRTQWDGAGGYPAFEKWCRDNRKSTMELLNRMRFNAVGSDVSMKQVRPGLMRATLSPHLWEQFKLRVIEFEQTPDGMKLLSIRPAP